MTSNWNSKRKLANRFTKFVTASEDANLMIYRQKPRSKREGRQHIMESMSDPTDPV